MQVACAGCGIPTETRFCCPKCVASSGQRSFFCSPECFKKAWAEHNRAFHPRAIPGTVRNQAFSGTQPSVTFEDEQSKLGLAETCIRTVSNAFHGAVQHEAAAAVVSRNVASFVENVNNFLKASSAFPGPDGTDFTVHSKRGGSIYEGVVSAAEDSNDARMVISSSREERQIAATVNKIAATANTRTHSLAGQNPESDPEACNFDGSGETAKIALSSAFTAFTAAAREREALFKERRVKFGDKSAEDLDQGEDRCEDRCSLPVSKTDKILTETENGYFQPSATRASDAVIEIEESNPLNNPIVTVSVDEMCKFAGHNNPPPSITRPLQFRTRPAAAVFSTESSDGVTEGTATEFGKILPHFTDERTNSAKGGDKAGDKKLRRAFIALVKKFIHLVYRVFERWRFCVANHRNIGWATSFKRILVLNIRSAKSPLIGLGAVILVVYLVHSRSTGGSTNSLASEEFLVDKSNEKVNWSKGREHFPVALAKPPIRLHLNGESPVVNRNIGKAIPVVQAIPRSHGVKVESY